MMSSASAAAGRLLDRGVAGAVHELRAMPAGEVFAGSVVGTTGLLTGLVAGLPLVALVHSSVDYPIVAALAWVLCAAGIRLGVTKGREIIKAAGRPLTAFGACELRSPAPFTDEGFGVFNREYIATLTGWNIYRDGSTKRRREVYVRRE